MKKITLTFTAALLSICGMAAAPAPVFSEVTDNTFRISWEGVNSLEEGNTTGAYIVNMATEERYDMYFLEDYMYSKANLRISGKYIVVNLTNNYPDLPGGKYQLYIPAGYVKFDGTEETNAAIDGYEFSYKVAWSDGPVVFAGPTDDGVITAIWTDATKVEYNEDFVADYFNPGVFISQDGTTVEVPYPDNISFAGNVMSIDLNRLSLKSGECRLNIPLAYVTVEIDGETGTNTAELSYDFTYVRPDEPGSGLSIPQAEGNDVRIYDLQGRRIKNPAKGSLTIRIENGKAVKQAGSR